MLKIIFLSSLFLVKCCVEQMREKCFGTRCIPYRNGSKLGYFTGECNSCSLHWFYYKLHVRPVSRAGFSLRLADHLLRLASRLAAAEPYSYGGGLLTRCAGGLPLRALASGGGGSRKNFHVPKSFLPTICCHHELLSSSNKIFVAYKNSF